MPTIPPLFDNGEIITDYLGKVNNHFASQCTPLDLNDELPLLSYNSRFNNSNFSHVIKCA